MLMDVVVVIGNEVFRFGDLFIEVVEEVIGMLGFDWLFSRF